MKTEYKTKDEQIDELLLNVKTLHEENQRMQTEIDRLKKKIESLLSNIKEIYENY